MPVYTVQAYIERRRVGRLLLALMTRTVDLFEFVLSHPEKALVRTNPQDGNEFLVVWVQDMLDQGIDIRVWVDEGVRVRIRDGHAYFPSADELEEMEEEEARSLAGRSRLRRAALTMAVDRWKSQLAINQALQLPAPSIDDTTADVLRLADEVISEFENEGITEVPEPDCEYCDPYGANLFPDSVCATCGLCHLRAIA